MALVRFNHCLIASNTLTDKLQDCLLTHLGVCPSSDDAWPTSVGARTLGVLAEVLLLRQQRERLSGTVKKQSDVAILKIWARFLLTMKTLVLNFENNTEEFDGRLIFQGNEFFRKVLLSQSYLPTRSISE